LTVLYDFKGENDQELSIKKDEKLTLVDDKVSDDWYYVKNSKGVSGYVPKTYVK